MRRRSWRFPGRSGIASSATASCRAGCTCSRTPGARSHSFRARRPAAGSVSRARPRSIGWVGRLTREKGADIFLEALALLPHRAWVASIVGEGRERAALEAQAARLGIADRVRWHGLVPDAAAIYPAFDAWVLSSRTEGTPIALFEAMAARVPAVVTTVGGVPDVVTPFEAILVRPEDPAALAAAIGNLLAEGDGAAARAEAGIQAALRALRFERLAGRACRPVSVAPARPFAWNLMQNLSCVLVAVPVALFGYAYFGYPALLWIGSRARPAPAPGSVPLEWPDITITVPCYNEERSIAATIESLLALDYPADRRHLLIISDASTDRTDEIVRGYADRGVELLRLPARGGKTAAENAAAARLRGEIVVNTDATIRIVPGALKALVAVFQDPTIGVASGRDVSVGDVQSAGNQGESGYVGYEMWIRSLETRLGTIVGASGCFFATRRELYVGDFPEALSRDFASCLIAREHGYRAVSVDAALALVPRAASLRSEYRRKVRTMARGLGTLQFKRHLLNPLRYGLFAPLLFSHKLCRWLFQLTLPLLVIGSGPGGDTRVPG